MAANAQTSSTELAPFLIEPRFVARVWGFDDLRPWYDCVVDSGSSGAEPIGEVWLTGNDCAVATGPHARKTLAQLFIDAPLAMLDSTAPSFESPLLVKMIFAREKLSVQVHPDDRLAQKYGQPRGKTECWYALAAELGAQMAAGVTIEQIRAGIHDGTLEDSLNLLPISSGDMVFVDAGTVHAIWPGSILLETQQNCDVTYRMYDYGRPRELHIDKSIEATRPVTRAGKVPAKLLSDRTILVDVEYFCVERIPVVGTRASASLPGPSEPSGGLAFLFAAARATRLTGKGFEPLEVPGRGIVAVPAASPQFTVENLGGLDLVPISPRWPGTAR